ncbi:DNA repair protein crb2 [Tolypocladium ophioglossoides CBS 100239]|uniref:DNA repair protein crb2 n=1 Tax=Tolypocladium ophioglossoides (strain CBS 100239) TaxID=1163406 RepID=A0A0L0NHA1_TOLOC|nr:DNA repair protein crb2 [Tolypocladium ophioglossoides CBS 100239]
MTRPRLLAQAEEIALEGNNESQDSQAIFDAHQARFGVGMLSSSPAPAQPRVANRDAEPGVDSFNEQRPGRLLAGVKAARIGDVEQTTDRDADDEVIPDAVHNIDPTRSKSFKRSAPSGLDDDSSVVKDTPPLAYPSSLQHRDAPPPHLNQEDRLPSVPAGADAPTRRMDVSQQTPTQVNEDRDYTAFCEPMPSSPVDQLTQRNTVDEPRTLQEGDTGAVNFGNLSDFPRQSSQISEDGGFDTTRGDWRAEARTSQLHSYPAHTPFKRLDVPPETPALPKNPFSTKASIAVPLAGSQLFGQTQQLSSAVKVSPTSSLPSPNLFLNSISPTLMEASPFKNRANVSSPTDIRTSSPRRLNEVPETLLKDRARAVTHEDSPADGRFLKEDLIPESPTLQAQRLPIGRQPLAHYEPMKQSQERKSNSDIQPLDLGFDNEDDGVFKKLERRKRAEKRRAQAREEMGRVSFPRHSRRESGEQPNRKKRRLHSIEEDAAGDEGAGPSRTKDQEVAAVRDSQKAPAPSLEAPSIESTKATPGEASAEAERAGRGEDASARHRTEVEPTDEEMIPATSPVRSSPRGNLRSIPPASEPELPALVDSDIIHEKQADNTMETSSVPPFYRTRAKWNPFLSSSVSEALPVEPGDRMGQAVSTLESPANTASTAHPSIVAESTARRLTGSRDDAEKQAQEEVSVLTRSRRSGRNPRTPLQPHPSEPVMAPSSSLTTLSATPVPSSKTTPGTQESDQPGSVNMMSPGSDRNLRKRALRMAAKSESPQPMTRATKVAKRSLGLDSDSTDELHHSPPPSTFDKSASYSKSGRSFRQSIGSTHRGRRLFEGMTFALSSQSDKPEQQRKRLESRVVQAGGSILKDGFQELFEQSAIMNMANTMIDGDDHMRLVRSSTNCGFTALIADGHSRKPKYMQALALGLPCLGHQWIAACLNKGEIVDWEPYLLCAGSSAVLGNAIRSRILPPYSAVDARLADVVEHRRRLLQDQSILVIVDAKKGRGETKQQYMFLVQCLGPSAISRVSTAQQAREALREREQAGKPFDWLYIDKSAGTAESVLSPPRSSGSRKKRQVAAEAPIRGDVRVLTDELVIQSLILGRMVEQEELKI